MSYMPEATRAIISHPEEQQILSAVAELLADTLDSVTLYVRLRHQLQEATTLYHITRSLNNTDNLDNALDEVVSVIRNTLDAHNARISLLDEEKKQVGYESFGVAMPRTTFS